MPQLCVFALLLCWSLLAWTPAARATDVAPSLEFARQGDSVVGAMRYRIPEGYHAYAHEAAETGRPTSLDLTLEGKGAMPVLYPAGSLQRDQYDPDSTVSTYEGEVILLALLPEEARGRLYAAELRMLLCSARHCVPVSQSLTGSVPELLPELSGRDWHEPAQALLKAAGKGEGGRPGLAPKDELFVEEGAAPPPRSTGAPAGARPATSGAGAEPSR
ncbi:MAG: protein-disulfide reductase DsbD N-terminal domain-containing protein, partial [Desulfovibrio sp.]|nr:protein-disulfide reductase DsbD N-terminal domain-containing protein [Desulfovibrio sp.]